MSDLGDTFTKECEKLKIEPNEYILEQLKNVNIRKESTTFCLSSRNLSPFICKAFTKVLQSNATCKLFFELDISDSILSHESFRTLFNGLTLTENVRILNLKGNNFDSSTLSSLANMIKENKSLLRLSLEWCNLGLIANDALPSLCEALSHNRSLIGIDLRHNSLVHAGVKSICSVIKENTALRSLDLRWNSIGSLGANVILQSLKSGCGNLISIELDGNDIPQETRHAISKYSCDYACTVEAARCVHVGTRQKVGIIGDWPYFPKYSGRRL